MTDRELELHVHKRDGEWTTPREPEKKPKRGRAGRKMKRFEVFELVSWIEAESEEEARKRLPLTRAFSLREVRK